MFDRTSAAGWLWCVCVAGVAAADTPVNYLDPPQGVFSDEWMIVELSGAKAGYTHSTMSRRGDMISTRSLTYFKIGRADQAIEVTLMQTSRESVQGAPRTFETVWKMGTTEMAMRGRVENGAVTLTSSQFGFETQQKGRLPEGAKMAWGLFRAGIEHGFTPGTHYELEVYEPLIRAEGPVKATVAVGERVKMERSGASRDVVKVTTAMQMGPQSIDSVAYVDENGQVLRAVTPFGGFEMTMTATTKERALAEFEPPEFFMDTLVKVHRAIDRQSATRIRYTLRVSGADGRAPELPSTPMQKPGARTERTATVEVARLDAAALKRIERVDTSGVAEEYLSASPSLNTADASIERMAQEAAGDETRPYAMADRLRVFVSRVIKDKNLNVGFATASEVCRKREGDCTEHAVLLAALGRARGLPSRVVVGLAYLPRFLGQKDVFGFHMWTQFLIGKQWVDFDAALRETDCSPARIALATSSLKDSAIGEVAFSIMDVIRGLEIEVQSIESR